MHRYPHQLCADLLSAKCIDRIGYRAGILAAHALVGTGLIGMAALCILCYGQAVFAGNPILGLLVCSSGPAVVGFAANAMGGQLRAGPPAAVAFPVLMLPGIISEYKIRK